MNNTVPSLTPFGPSTGILGGSQVGEKRLDAASLEAVPNPNIPAERGEDRACNCQSDTQPLILPVFTIVYLIKMLEDPLAQLFCDTRTSS